MKIFLIAGIVVGTATAEERSYFPMIGVEFGAAKSSYDTDRMGYDTDTETGWGVRGGLQDDSSRIYASFHYVGFDETGKSDSFYTKFKSDQYDLVLNMEAKSDSFRLYNSIASFFFVGAHIGGVYVDYDTEYRNDDQSDKKSDSGYGLASGAQAGAAIKINDRAEIEAGYRYTWSTLDIDDVELDHTDNFYFAFTYDF
ncbi:outer membrane beta-barrel protein [Hydrogenimonas sp.]